MANNVNASVLQYMELSGQALQEAQTLADKIAVDEAKVAEHAPKLASALLEQQLVRQDELGLLTRKLSSTVGALEVAKHLLTKLAEVRAEYAKLSDVSGHGLGKAAETGGSRNRQPTNSSCFVGLPLASGEKRASDLIYEEMLGIG